jgi:putative tricarboxylic transport membrane protein
LMKFDFEPAPLLLGFVIGPMMEENLRRSFVLSDGDPRVFVERPVTAVLLAIAIVALLIAALPSIRQKRNEAFVE